MNYEPLYHAPLNMVSECMIFLGVFIFILVLFSIFWGRFNKTIIPLALVGYKIIIANSYPTLARGRTVILLSVEITYHM